MQTARNYLLRGSSYTALKFPLAVHAIVAKRHVISQKRQAPRFLKLLSTDKKSHKLFHMPRKLFAGLRTPVYGRPYLATDGFNLLKLVHCAVLLIATSTVVPFEFSGRFRFR